MLNFLFPKKIKTEISDLTPRGVARTIKSEFHGKSEDYNAAFTHIFNQLKKI